jgi:hypothetical protein
MTDNRDDYESSCTCAVCMEDLGTKVSACPCGHVYHTECINKWMRQQRTCPQCKACAVPLTKLQFNLFTLRPEESSLPTSELVSALKSEQMVLSLALDNEVAEINVLEPQLAECQAEEKAYMGGIGPRKKRKDELEHRLLSLRGSLLEHENRHKVLQEEFDVLRNKLFSMFLDDFSSSSTSRRPIAQSEIPKIITFMVADARRLLEIKAEKKSLESQLSELKQKLTSVTNSIRSLGSSGPGPVSKQDFRLHGFVPIDVFGVKRKREEDVPLRKPQLPNSSVTEISSSFDSLTCLNLLVSLLSDNEDEDIMGISAPRIETELIILE